MVNLPVFFTSAVARSVNESRSSPTCFFFMSNFEDKDSQMAPFDKATAFFFCTPFMAFIAFTMVGWKEGKTCEALDFLLLEPM